jgi:hypothetical protein
MPNGRAETDSLRDLDVTAKGHANATLPRTLPHVGGEGFVEMGFSPSL